MYPWGYAPAKGLKTTGVNTCNRFQILMHEELEEVEPNCLWEDVKHSILKEAHDNVPKKQIAKKSPWLSSTAINNVRNRRKAKAVGDSKSYKKLNAEFQKQARRDKEAYLNYLCNIIQKYNLNSKILYKTIKKITRKRTPNCVF